MLRVIWMAIRAPRGGWKIEVLEGEQGGERWVQGVWVRKGPGWFGRAKRGLGRVLRNERAGEDGNDPDVLVVDERRTLLG